jgi:hypothetical protein
MEKGTTIFSRRSSTSDLGLFPLCHPSSDLPEPPRSSPEKLAPPQSAHLLSRMGAFFQSIQAKADNRDAVISAVESLLPAKTVRALVGPVINGWIGIYVSRSAAAESFTNDLSDRLKTHVLDLVVHDSDIFVYNYFRDGQVVDEYSSSPDYFEEVSKAEHQRLKGKPQVFRDLIGSDKKLAELESLLKESHGIQEFLFEENRLEKFAALFGIANTLTSYEYLTDDEWDGIEGRKQFIHVPDLTAEKNAAKAAAAALNADKNQLKKEGVLCFETQPKDRFIIGRMIFDPLNGGLLFNWSGYGARSSQILFHAKPPWTSPEESIELPTPPSVGTELVFSKTGKWFAFADEKLQLQLWHWPDRKPINEIKLQSWPLQFSTDEKRLLCQTQNRLEILSLETLKVIQTVPIGHRPPQFLAWHPSGRYVLVKHRQDQFGIVDLEAGTLKILYSGTICDWSQLAGHFAGNLKKSGIPEEQLAEMKQGMIRGSDEPFNCKFGPDGRLLFCATTRGLRVLEWDKVLGAEKSTPAPLFAASPAPLESPMKPSERRDYINYTYDVVLDEQKNRLLFGGTEGAVRFLNLNDGSTGVLLKPAGDDYIWRLHLSADREFVGCVFSPSVDERNKKPGRIQVCNYRLLRTAAGLD